MATVTMSSGKAAFCALALVIVAGIARADELGDAAKECESADIERRLAGCSTLLMSPGLNPGIAAQAYELRALAYEMKGRFDEAIADYNRALTLNPASPVGLNNRAWAYVKSGRPAMGEGDVERSLAMDPRSPDAYDTRAHIRQAAGRLQDALDDYNAAIRYGGERTVKLYQCGLQSQGLYDGMADGKLTQPLLDALSKCVLSGTCDPLPPDEECRNASS
jgi:tetratricopeptide (TPR) repeat protein